MARRDSSAPVQAGPLPSRTLVVDTGAYTIKAGFASTDTDVPDHTKDDCHVIPNCIARSRTKQTYVGSELEQCSDFGEITFKRPVEKGYIVNWEAEKRIWEHEFFEDRAGLHV